MDLNELKKDETVKKLFESVHEEYKLPEGAQYNDSLNKKMELVSCQLLMEVIEEAGGDENDMIDILRYIAVVIDAEKERLDWERAYMELDIDGMIEKYIE